ncbi:tripartite tricarboxylate transporter permease [Halomonas salipaludis]|uniref:C4-dicarboxylate ABC transporter permease n=1 Tax=Halomonas salipaludis TaxID=2032625 RepID=A0A2A2EPZ3_9GAMM|nr:tripartite tricarboxylate transporter permease [Halomonas salipaludis]PAU75176.1 C4-dicarboxylate ABC transporter permease [Halomonas salipaludis]
MLIDTLTAFVATLASPLGIALALGGVLLGIVLGALPGVSSTMALAILLPLSFGMQAELAILFLLSVFVASVYGGSISAILINIPGTPGAIVTQLDGYPMAQAGQAKLALSHALLASSLGGLVGLALLMVVAPWMAAMAMQFRSPEFTAVAVFGLVLLAYASPGSTVRGLLVGALGVICGMVGFDLMTDMPRFTFGSRVLQGGVELVPLCIGLFGLAEVMKHIGPASRPATRPVAASLDAASGALRSFVSYWKSALRGSTIGALIGAIPAAGSAIAVAIAYAQERRLSRHPERFGKGAGEGVVAPEAANSSSIGGTLIPMMTLGVPGDAITAVLMGSLLMHGMRPGPMLFAENPEFVASIYAGFAIALLLTLLLGFLLMRWMTWILRIPTHLLLVGIALLCVIGAFSIRNSLADVYIMLFFGVLGYLLYLMSLPAAPLAFGLILGPLLEENLRRSLILGRGTWDVFLNSPIAMLLLAMSLMAIALPLLLPLLTRIRQREC